MKENKGLSDKELALKYEAGAVNLSKVVKGSFDKYDLNKRVMMQKKTKK